nr:MAG TPA: hypothetical protein [Caudoviricetes sp.]
MPFYIVFMYITFSGKHKAIDIPAPTGTLATSKVELIL